MNEELQLPEGLHHQQIRLVDYENSYNIRNSVFGTKNGK